MSVAELIDQVMSLPAGDRAELVTAIFDSVDTLEDTSDDELFDIALKRDQEIEDGSVKAISHKEFMQHFSARNAN
jgi:putative addiction module component (TIGR02574 family)